MSMKVMEVENLRKFFMQIVNAIVRKGMQQDNNMNRRAATSWRNDVKEIKVYKHIQVKDVPKIRLGIFASFLLGERYKRGGCIINGGPRLQRTTKVIPTTRRLWRKWV